MSGEIRGLSVRHVPLLCFDARVCRVETPETTV